jgi:signal transduction histidine kinase
MPPALIAAADRGDIARQRLRVGGAPLVAVATKLRAAQVSYVEVFPLRDLDRIFRFISLMLLGGVLASGLLGASTGWWASRRVLRPLTELTSAAARIARRPVHPAARAGRQGSGLIAAAFNETAGAGAGRPDARFASDVSHGCARR